MKINLPVFKDEDTKDAMMYASPVCHSVLARLPWRGSAELQDGYNLGQCVNDLG